MVSLIILKHIRNISDESVAEQWFENIYYQYFSREKSYARGAPCETSELVHFRNRIGTEEIELVFKESIRINGKDGREREGTTDTTVQEKKSPTRQIINYIGRLSKNAWPLHKKKALSYGKVIIVF